MKHQLEEQEQQDEQAGFGLLEAIVALAIASLALAVLYRAQAGAVRGSGRAQAYVTALGTTRAQLDSIASDGTLRSGQASGRHANGFGWRLDVKPLDKIEAKGAERMYWIALETFDRDGFRLVRLETAKLARELE